MMAELIHSTQSFMNAKDKIIAKKKKKAEWVEVGYAFWLILHIQAYYQTINVRSMNINI